MNKKTNNKPSKFRNSRKNSRAVNRETDKEATPDRRYTGDRRDMQRCADNDPAWYSVNGQLLTDSASFPYSWPVGNSTSNLVNDSNVGKPFELQQMPSVPGVLAMYLSPTVGWADNSESPVNVAARNIYSFVRHANSGHSNYDAPDLMLYLLAMDSCYSFHSFLRRLYGVMMDYTPVNRYYPRSVVHSMNVDFDDAMAHLAQLRYFINQFAVKLGSMCVPNSMSYIVRHMWMYSGIFVDSASQKAQTYLYTPHAFYKYGLINEVGGLNYTVFAAQGGSGAKGRLTVKDLIDFGNKLMVPILQSEDMNIMSGDILKAYGADGVIKIMGVSEDYQVLPMYSEEVISQFQNATPIGYYNSDNAAHVNDITQNVDINAGYLVHKPTVVAAMRAGNVAGLSQRTPWTFDRLVSIRKSGVTPADTMVATRLTNIGSNPVAISSGANSGYTAYEIHTAGSEICHAMIVYYYGIDATGAWTDLSSPYLFVGDAVYVPGTINTTNVMTVEGTYQSVTENINDFMQTAAMLSVFERHPLLYPTLISVDYDADGAATVYQYLGATNYLFDVDNYAILSHADLERMADTALISEFSVPQMGKFNEKLS